MTASVRQAAIYDENRVPTSSGERHRYAVHKLAASLLNGKIAFRGDNGRVESGIPDLRRSGGTAAAAKTLGYSVLGVQKHHVTDRCQSEL